jgi:hypothetical protein
MSILLVRLLPPSDDFYYYLNGTGVVAMRAYDQQHAFGRGVLAIVCGTRQVAWGVRRFGIDSLKRKHVLVVN